MIRLFPRDRMGSAFMPRSDKQRDDPRGPSPIVHTADMRTVRNAFASVRNLFMRERGHTIPLAAPTI